MKKRLLSLALAACLMLTLIPATAFASPMEDITVSHLTMDANGVLKSFVLGFKVGNSYAGNRIDAATARIAIQDKQFDHPTDRNNPGDFSEEGDYAEEHRDYDSWDDIPSTDVLCWADGDGINRPKTGETVENQAVTFNDSSLQLIDGNTYYVYAWTYWKDSPTSKVYPDEYLFSFTVSGQQIVADKPADPDAQPAPTTHTHDWLYTGSIATITASVKMYRIRFPVPVL